MIATIPAGRLILNSHMPPLPPLGAGAPAATDGGSQTLVLLVFAALVLATVLSLYLAGRLYQGYRRGGGRGMLLLGFGLVLLTTVPILLRFVLSNVPGIALTVQELVATLSQLVGLLVILVVIYARR